MKKAYILFLLAGLVCATSATAQTEQGGAAAGKVAETATRTVSGKVVLDATGEPLAGVSLQVVGARYSAMTDETGTFSIKVPVDGRGRALSVLSVSSPTAKGVMIPVRDREQLDIRLMEDGYRSATNNVIAGPLGKREISQTASAISFIGGDNSLSVKGSPEALMQGQVSGLNTLFRSGTDWSGANLVLRGYNSLYANNNPLLVIDGLIIENQEFGVSLIEGQISTPLGCIDVKDIDQIVVMKDATSIYGTKGGNGAIIIQTKRTEDLSTHIDVSAFWGLNMQPKKYPMLGAADSKRYLTELAQTSGLSAKAVSDLTWINAKRPSQNPDQTWNNGDYYKYNQNTDWQDEIYQSGFKQQYSLSVSGGDETAIYGVSLGFQNKDGLVKGSDFQRFNARLNAAIKFTDRIRFNTSMSFVYGSKNLSNEGSTSNVNPMYTALVKAPFTSVNSIDEYNKVSPAYEEVDALGAANPAVVTDNVVSENSFYRFMGSYTLEADLWKNWKLSTIFGLDYNKEREVIFYPTSGIPYDNLSNAEVTNQQMHRVERLFSISDETRLNYSNRWGSHSLDGTVGFRYHHNVAEDDYGRGYNSASNYYQTISSGDPELYQNGGALGNWNWLSFYGHADYAYADRYFVDVTLSTDASSRYGDNIQPLQVYPGVNAAWLISGESWMKNATWMPYLKLRAGYNMSGNDDIGNYVSRRYYITQSFLNNNGLVRGGLTNKDIKPERVTKANVGIDAAFLNERLTLSVDAYRSKTKDLLIYSNAQSFTGFSTYVSNGGELTNTGVEVSLGGRVINKKHFAWDLNLSVAHNKNEIQKLDCGSLKNAVGDGTVLTSVGSSMGVFYGYKTDGVYSTSADASAAGLGTMVGSVRKPFEAGDVRFVDQNGDKLIDGSDMVEIGNPNPTLFGGFVSVMKSHRFTLTAQFNYSLGNDVYNYTRSQLESMSGYVNQTRNVLNRWRTEGDVTSVPRATYGDPLGNSRFSDRWIEDGSYLKLKELTLAYDFNIHSSYVTGLTVFGTCENLFTLTDYKGSDPEIVCSASNNPLYQGVDAFTTPTTPTFYIGLKLGL